MDGGDVSGAGQVSTRNGLSLLNGQKIIVVKVVSYCEVWNFYVEYKFRNQ